LRSVKYSVPLQTEVSAAKKDKPRMKREKKIQMNNTEDWTDLLKIYRFLRKRLEQLE
jgi:hypothetical protein